MVNDPVQPISRPVLVPETRSSASLDLPLGARQIGRVACFDGTPDFLEVRVLLEPGAEVRPGELLGVWHGRRTSVLTVVQVTQCAEVNPNEEPQLVAARQTLGLEAGYGEEGTSTRIFRLASCATLEEFDVVEGPVDAGAGSRSPVLLCRSGDPVVRIPAPLQAKALGLAPSEDKGLDLGIVRGEDDLRAVISPVALQLHMGIFGNPGKGKSYLSGVVLEEATRWGLPCLILDINGEMVDAVKELGGDVIALPDRAQFGLALDQLTPSELVEITPNVQKGMQYAELLEYAHERLLSDQKETQKNLIALDRIIVQCGADLGLAALTIRTAQARLNGLKKDPLIGDGFSFAERLSNKRLVLLDCRRLTLNQTRLVATAAARALQEIGRRKFREAAAGNRDAAAWLAIYFVDEAHLVIPEDERTVSAQVHFELARMGRHVRTGMILASQSPQDLNRSVLKRLQTRFVFALEKDQLRSLEGVLADLDEKLLRQLPKLPRGTCAVSGTSEVIKHGFLLDVRPRETVVKGSTPQIFEGRTKGSLKRRVVADG